MIIMEVLSRSVAEKALDESQNKIYCFFRKSWNNRLCLLFQLLRKALASFF